ncbi:EAL domain-containing protein [Cupriavidus basilensis]
MSDVEKASSVLDALKQAGVSTSLDDFGSGYSSLAYLVRLPIDTLKIDKSFVWALGRSAPGHGSDQRHYRAGKGHWA